MHDMQQLIEVNTFKVCLDFIVRKNDMNKYRKGSAEENMCVEYVP